MIPYTNMAPYRELGAPVDCTFMPCVPRESIAALKRGRILAAAVPVGGLLVLEEMVEPAGRFGIAAKEESKSVLFFSDRPFAKIRAPGMVYLTNESASSIRLLYLLIGYRHGFDSVPYVTNNIRKANGELVIGDEALKKRFGPDNRAHDQPEPNFDYITDLAEEWYVFHKLPFVFARWVVRKDAPVKLREALENWLAEFQEREEELVNRSAPEAAKSIGVPIEDIMDYFRTMRRTLDDEDIAGQELFLQELQKHIREPLFDHV